jgi:hypothetical protein
VRDTRIYDSITNAQNTGVPCPFCNFISGHKVTCRTLNGTIDTPEFQPLSTQAKALVDILVLSTEDRLRLRSLGVKW